MKEAEAELGRLTTELRPLYTIGKMCHWEGQWEWECATDTGMADGKELSWRRQKATGDSGGAA